MKLRFPTFNVVNLLRRPRALAVVMMVCLLPARPATAEMMAARQFATPVLTVAPDHTPKGWAVLGVSLRVEPRGDAATTAGGAPPDRPGADGGHTFARRDDDIFVHVQELEAWMAEMKRIGKAPAGGAEIRNLVLFLNGIPIRGVRPNHFFTYPENRRDAQDPLAAVSERQVHYLRFTLARTEESRAAWSRLLRHPSFEPREMEVSVGFDNGEMVPTYVTTTSQARFYFRPIHLGRFCAGAVVILGSLFLFLWLARKTDVIRDTAAPLRPDGLRPYSLARAQMAFWFFLTVSAFFLLWVLTGAMDTLNSSVLGLIGISAATALGAAFVDVAAAGEQSASPARAGRNLPAVDLSLSRRKIRERLGEQVRATEAALSELEARREGIAAGDQRGLDANARAITEAREELETLRVQRRYFEWPAWRAVLNDLLTEKNFVSFHRFQILVWTLVLGVMFVAGVYTELAMPEFSATLLGLLGISGGTYVGFKLPGAQRE